MWTKSSPTLPIKCQNTKVTALMSELSVLHIPPPSTTTHFCLNKISMLSTPYPTQYNIVNDMFMSDWNLECNWPLGWRGGSHHWKQNRNRPYQEVGRQKGLFTVYSHIFPHYTTDFFWSWISTKHSAVFTQQKAIMFTEH